jgi:uncharacterized BrkB/YihY/UPF0761 family membrane protein
VKEVDGKKSAIQSSCMSFFSFFFLCFAVVQALPKLTARHQTKLMLFKATHDCDWSAIWRDKFLVLVYLFVLVFFFLLVYHYYVTS